MSVQTSVSVSAASVRGACGLCVCSSSSAALIKAHSRPDHTRPRAATCATRGRAEIGGHVVVRGAEHRAAVASTPSMGNVAAYKLHNARPESETQSQRGEWPTNRRELQARGGKGAGEGEGGGVGGWQVKPAKCNEIAFNFCNFSTTRRKTETETKTEN